MKVKLLVVLDGLSVFVNLRRRYCRTGWAKNYAPNSCSYIHQILMDFTYFIFHKVV